MMQEANDRAVLTVLTQTSSLLRLLGFFFVGDTVTPAGRVSKCNSIFIHESFHKRREGERNEGFICKDVGARA